MKLGVAVFGCHRRGGIERVALETVNQLARRGHRVRLVTYDADEAALAPGVDLQRLVPPPGPRLYGAIRFPALADAALRAGGATDVRVGFGSLAAPGSVVWVTSVHARWMEVVRSGEVQRDWRRRLNPFHPLMLRQERRQYAPGYHRRLLAMGPAVTQDLVRFCGTRAEDVRELPHGYDDTAFSVPKAFVVRDATRRQLGYAEADRVVLCVTNEIPRKGVGTLVAAVAGIEDPATKLLVVGRVDADAVGKIADDAGLSRTRLKVVASANDVVPYYAAADVFALATLYDSWGLVIVEAMACGVPVVTTSRAGAASAVRAGVSGTVLDDPGDVGGLRDALVHWLDRGASRSDAERAAAVAQSVEPLVWDAVMGRYEALLEEVAL